MLIVGEKINTSRKEIREAVARRDAKFIREIARRQYEAGANMIDVNCGTFVDEEPEILSWLVQEVQEELEGVPLCLDSPNPKALRAALQVHRGEALVNSISGETERFQNILPLLKEFNCRVVVLCMDSKHGIPPVTEEFAKEIGADGYAPDAVRAVDLAKSLVLAS
ncbi:MAG: dihydropteroate synthase [Thermacetogeniaceae bacterium]